VTPGLDVRFGIAEIPKLFLSTISVFGPEPHFSSGLEKGDAKVLWSPIKGLFMRRGSRGFSISSFF